MGKISSSTEGDLSKRVAKLLRDSKYGIKIDEAATHLHARKAQVKTELDKIVKRGKGFATIRKTYFPI